ncbi:MAG: NAD-dependent epimerase/dehydratase family protein [Propioniciclava sp.]
MANDVVLYESHVYTEDVRTIVEAPLPWETYRDQRILVTGASGMIPMYLVGALLAANEVHGLNLQVDGLVRNRAKAEARFGKALARSDFQLIARDVSHPAPIDAYSTIFHGASPARPVLHSSSPVTTLKANVLGTIAMLDALTSGGSFVLLSSSEVYGAVPGVDLISENDQGPLEHFAPRAAYSEGKRLAETAMAAYEAEFAIRPLALRFGHIYGPGLTLDDGRVQADFLADVVNHRNVRMMSAGVATRTYTYVADAARGAFYAHLLGGASAYNVADPAGHVSIRELAETFAASRPAMNLSLAFANPDDSRSFSPVPSLGLDSGRLRRLGWEPLVPLAEGISRTVRAFEEGPLIN